MMTTAQRRIARLLERYFTLACLVADATFAVWFFWTAAHLAGTPSAQRPFVSHGAAIFGVLLVSQMVIGGVILAYVQRCTDIKHLFVEPEGPLTRIDDSEPLRQHLYFDGKHMYRCCWEYDPCIYHLAFNTSDLKKPEDALREIREHLAKVVARGDIVR